MHVACGNYGAQEIDYDRAKADSSSYVTFEPSASGACWNQTAGITVAASYLVLQGVAYGGGIGVRQTGLVDLADLIRGSHIVVDGQSGGRFDIGYSSSDVTVENSDLGNCVANHVAPCLMRIQGSDVSGVVVKNTKIHDVYFGSDPLCGSSGCHTNGLAAFGVNGLLLDGDSFYNNDTADVRIQDTSSTTANQNSNVTIENSWLGRVANGQGVGISVDSSVPGLLVRFNSFSSAYTPGGYPGGAMVCFGDGEPLRHGGGTACGTDASPAQIYGNLWTGSDCASDATFAYNVVISHSPYTGTTLCGATDTLYGYGGQKRFPYSNDPTTGQPNFNITGRVWMGDNHIPVSRAKRYPRTDFHGIKRSIWRGRLDVGAVQRVKATPARHQKRLRHRPKGKRG